MKQKPIMEIRLLTKNDIDFIADYWLKSDKEFLINMGVDLSKLPTREGLTKMLQTQIQLPDSEKSSLALILYVDNKPLGHCNVNNIVYGQEASMHLHLWNKSDRRKGLGTQMVIASLPVFFDRLQLKTIWSEPYSKNPSPNRTLKNIGFELVKRYVTIPGSLNFEQEVNQWKMTKEKFETLNISTHK